MGQGWARVGCSRDESRGGQIGGGEERAGFGVSEGFAAPGFHDAAGEEAGGGDGCLDQQTDAETYDGPAINVKTVSIAIYFLSGDANSAVRDATNVDVEGKE